MNDISPTQVIERETLVPAIPQPVFVPLASPSCAQVCGALAIAQGAFKTPKRTKPATVEGVTKGGRSYSYKYMYAPLEELIDAVKDALAANGLMRHQYLINRSGQTMMRTIIWHASGEWIASDYPVFPTKEGGQGFASGVTYARRYGLSLALGLAPEDDDDGNITEERPPVPLTEARPVANSNAVPGNGNGRPHSAPQVKPLPAEPQQVYDPETGEVEPAEPYLIRVGQVRPGHADWIGWGGELVNRIISAPSTMVLEEWLKKNYAALNNCVRDAPKVSERIQVNIDATRDRLQAKADDRAEAEVPDYMDAPHDETADATG